MTQGKTSIRIVSTRNRVRQNTSNMVVLLSLQELRKEVKTRKAEKVRNVLDEWLYMVIRDLWHESELTLKIILSALYSSSHHRIFLN